MVTSPYQWKILEWHVIQQTNKETVAHCKSLWLVLTPKTIEFFYGVMMLNVNGNYNILASLPMAMWNMFSKTVIQCLQTWNITEDISLGKIQHPIQGPPPSPSEICRRNIKYTTSITTPLARKRPFHWISMKVGSQVCSPSPAKIAYPLYEKTHKLNK